MGVKIDLKNLCSGNDKMSCGGNVYHFNGGNFTESNLIVKTSDGHQISGISSVTISIKPDSMVVATIECEVDSIENMNAISAEFKNLELSFIEREVEKYGYKLVKDDAEH